MKPAITFTKCLFHVKDEMFYCLQNPLFSLLWLNLCAKIDACFIVVFFMLTDKAMKQYKGAGATVSEHI